MAYGESFISKVLDTGDVNAFDRFSIVPDLLPTQAERKAYEFIHEYAESNNGEVPSSDTVEAEVEGFVYIPQVSDSFKFMADAIKEYKARVDINDFWNDEATARLFSESASEDFIEEAIMRLEYIRQSTEKKRTIGFDLKRDIEKFRAEYKKRKAGESFRLWKSKFHGINAAIGGYYTGNAYAWFGRSGRGKSVFVLCEGIESAMQGANVLIWSLEMPWYELASRLIPVVAAHAGLLEVTTPEGDVVDAGFETRGILTGGLDDEMEAHMLKFLERLNEIIPGNIIIRGVDDPEFTRRDCRQLEMDIKQTNADVVIVDPIYYMDMEANTSKTAGGDVAKTSQKLRHIAGRNNVVMHVITQAEEEETEEDDVGNRMISLPQRKHVKKAKQILEDATNLFAIDTSDGRGMIGIAKGRNGGEDIKVEVQFMPEVGIIREVEFGFGGLEGEF